MQGIRSFLRAALCVGFVGLPANAQTFELLFVGLFAEPAARVFDPPIGISTEQDQGTTVAPLPTFSAEPAPGADFVRPMALTAFLDMGQTLNAEGRRLEKLEIVRSTSGDILYSGLWLEGSGNLALSTPPMNFNDFIDELEQRRTQGLRPVDVEEVANPRRIVGVFRAGSGGQRVTRLLPLDRFSDRIAELSQENLRLVDHSVQLVGNAWRYRGVFREGTGAQRFVAPRSRGDFIAQRNAMLENGLELVDLALSMENGEVRYSGIFRPGDRRVGVSRPAHLADFQKLILEQREQGQELVDFATVLRPEASGGGTSGGGPIDDPLAALPLPDWLELSSESRVVVDFSLPGSFRMTLPQSRAFYRDDIPIIGGQVAVPDRMCGVSVRRPIRFDWIEDGERLDEAPLFIAQPEDDPSTLGVDEEFAFFTDEQFLGGIGFTGPIGACTGDSQWRFPEPFTTTDLGFTAPQRRLTLVISLGHGAEIDFIDSAVPDVKPIDVDKLFEDDDFKKKIEAILATFKTTNSDEQSGICGVANFLLAVCTADPTGFECDEAKTLLDAAGC
jgi:hypothetical protein